jgi:carbamoyl-phosphate synthase large subunit
MSHSNVLITCGGKWVGMVIQMREAMKHVPALKNGRIIVSSTEPLTPAGCFADDSVVVPPIASEKYVEKLLDICKQCKIKVVVPLIDLDLEKLSQHLADFSKIGTTVVCPNPQLVDLCLDKHLFERFVREENIPYPHTYSLETLANPVFPVFFKRRRGYGSIGTGICTDISEAKRAFQNDSSIIFQEFVSSREISVDAFISRTGKSIIAVQRVREKVVGGEAHKSQTIRSAKISEITSRILSSLATRGLNGPVNIQLFDTNPPIIIEVNTRLGSASVLSNIACDGSLYRAVLNEACGGTSEGDPSNYTIDISLYRFLGDVFYVGNKPLRVTPDRDQDA